MGTVIWKEWRSLLGGGSAGSGAPGARAFGMLPPALARYVTPSSARTLFVPVLFGVLEGSGAHMHFVFAVVAVLAGAMIGAESFAGERERGTLETLLASPLSDAAITAGKLLAGWLYALLLVGEFLVVMVPVRLGVLGASAFSLHSVAQAAVSAVMVLLLALGVIEVAVLASTWAQSTRVAMQTTYGAFLGVGFLIAAVAKYHLAPGLGRFLAHVAQHGWSLRSGAIVATAIVTLDAAGYVATRLRCTRAILLAQA